MWLNIWIVGLGAVFDYIIPKETMKWSMKTTFTEQTKSYSYGVVMSMFPVRFDHLHPL